ncbi:MAG: hypothetical protein ACI4WX_15630 [Aristaeellaceae bacterium]
MFRKIDPTVVKETRFIALVVLILSLLMQAVFLVIGQWDYTVLLGNLYGMAAAVGNFFLMGLTVQHCLTLEPADAKKKMQFSQQMRLLMLLVLCMIGAALSCFNTIALLLPQFFPRIGVTIRGLTMKNKES